MICEYCNKQFKTTSSLNLHIKTAKYCLQIQNKLNEEYKCFSCNKFLTSKYNLTLHLEKCTTLYKLNLLVKDKNDLLKKENNILKNENIILKDKLNILKGEINILKGDHECIQDIAKQPKNITTNTNNKILNIITPLNFTNKEDIKNKINDSYKLDYIFSGQKGVAKFAVDHILKDEEGNLKYVCTDPSRQIFKYKDETGEVRKDVEAKKLTNFLVEGGIKHKASKIMNDWWTEETGITNTDKFELLVDKAESLRVIDSDNNDFKKELSTLTTV